MIRKQRFAGTWYPRDRASLEKITHLDAVEDPKVRFGVVPHAGLFYSAPLIRLFFSALESDIDKLVVIAPSIILHCRLISLVAAVSALLRLR